MAENATESGNGSISVEAELTPEALDTLRELAKLRGVDANTVLQQAISTEKLLADNVGVNDEVLIKTPEGTYSKVLFNRTA